MAMKRTETLERLTRYLWSYKLTVPGRYLVITGLLTGSLATPSLEVPVFRVFLALFSVGALAWFLNLLLRPRVEVRGAFPGKATAGQPVTGTYTIENQGHLPILDCSLAFFGLDRSLKPVDGDRLLRRLPRGASATLPVTLEPLRRGVYPLPSLRAFTTFPFNICRNGARKRGGGPLIVLPAFHPLSEVDVPIGTRYQPGGIALTSDVGESPEYIGNREYRPGDPTRRIDFRAWARLAQPVVREFQEEYYCRVALVLDTFVPRRLFVPRGGYPELEAAVSLSSSVADALSRGEYIIDIFAAGPELYVFRAGRHTAHLESVLEILAGVDECKRDPFEVVAPALADELGSISTVVCVFLDWDPSREALLRTALEAGCSAKTFIVRDKPTSHPYAPAEDWAGPITQLSLADIRNGGIERL